MKLTKLRIQNFRNYPEREFVCSPMGALVLGPNGSGKTNFLEAIAYSSFGKSVRYQPDDYLLRFGQRHFSLQADFDIRIGDCCIKADYTSGKKSICINQVPIKHLSQIYQYIKVVYCSPEDIYLVNGSPRKRRQYFDLAIAQFNPAYISLLRHYVHVVEQRNVLLKDCTNKQQKKHWDELFLTAALPVIGARIEYINKLVNKIHALYDGTVPEAEPLRVEYKPTLNPLDKEDAQNHYRAELNRVENREWQYQRTLLGPHLDDYDIHSAGRLYKDVGSQGQKRTVTLLIKIAHLEILRDVVGEYPILLLDDIFAELDKQHTAQFMKILQNHEQVFVASPNPITAEHWPELPVIDLAEGAGQP